MEFLKAIGEKLGIGTAKKEVVGVTDTSVIVAKEVKEKLPVNVHITTMFREGKSCKEIADAINEMGYKTTKDNAYFPMMIGRIIKQLKLKKVVPARKRFTNKSEVAAWLKGQGRR